jgi:hypothetical protein
MSAQIELNASVFISEQLNRQLINTSQDLAYRCVGALAEHYNFDAEEATRLLGLAMIRVERKAPIKAKAQKVAKVLAPKSAFFLPYNGEFNDICCYALRQNKGLYTQCTSLRKGDAQFCKGCASAMQKIGAEVPEYGTIQQRMAVGILDYVDPKGRKPVAYAKVMKKYKVTKEQVLDEAGKLNIVINPEHFVVAEETKRGRPKTEKEAKAKGVKGRPKKVKKVLLMEDEEEDLFASLVANANVDEEEMAIVSNSKKGKTDEEKKAEDLAAQKLKAEKEAKRIAAEKLKAEKEAKLQAEKLEKEAKKKQECLAREEKKKAEEAEKLAKKQAAEKAKADKEAKLAAEKLTKANKGKKSDAEEEDEEPDIVKKIEFEGKKYLKSKKTGIVYDYKKYVQEGEQEVVGNWNNTSNKIDFLAAEEEEEEYDIAS